MDIGQRIKTVRESKRVTQLEIAAALGVDNSYYSKLERRGNKLSFEQVERIADVLGTTVKHLLYPEDNAASLENEEAAKRIQELSERVIELKDRLKDKEELLKLRNFEIKALENFIICFGECASITLAADNDYLELEYEYQGEITVKDFEPNSKNDWATLISNPAATLKINETVAQVVMKDLTAKNPFYDYLSRFIGAAFFTKAKMYLAAGYYLEQFEGKLRWEDDEGDVKSSAILEN